MSKAATIRQDTGKFRAALKANPKDFDGLVGMAGLEASMGNTDAAATYVNTAAPLVTKPRQGKLLDAYNAVGDGYQNGGKVDQAIPYFKRAIVAGFDTQTAYARISIAACYAQSNRLAEAKPYAEAILKMSNPPKEYADQAKMMLDMIKKSK